MDQQVLLISYGYWPGNPFTSAQTWAYGTSDSGMPGFHGFHRDPYYRYPYPPAGFQSLQAASVPLYATDHHATSTHSDIFRYSMPGFQASYVPRTRLHHQIYQMQQGSQPLNAPRETAGSLSNQSHNSGTQPSFYASATTKRPSLQLPRGPPRKPKRSGPAMWVGNIPTGTPVEVLRDHFSKGATEDIESVYLMSKSNCAFVNYTTKEACCAAVERFNNSPLGCVRLLCRIRRDPSGTREGSQLPESVHRSPISVESTKSSSASSSEWLDEVGERIASMSSSRNTVFESPRTSPHPTQHPLLMEPRSSDRYFVLKCLAKEDLQDSLIRGTWETQSHNQQILHDAFCAASNVYLVFSINKSGEYFGYARMTSSPFDSSSQQITFTPSIDTSSNDGFRTRKTPATATAPRGYVIDDCKRGVLFWEAQREHTDSIASSDSSRPLFDRAHSGGKPFRVQWLSVRRVTFQRTKGMRNAWNANKEVKVARDGTELETETGKSVVALFHEIGET